MTVTFQFVFLILTYILSNERLSLAVSLAFGPGLRFAARFEIFRDWLSGWITLLAICDGQTTLIFDTF